MTREELKVGQIIFDEKDNCYLVYKINDAKNIVYCLNYEFATARICLDDLRYFDVCDEIDLDLLISELRGEQDFRTGPHTVVLDRININGKAYWAADKVLEIIDEVAADNLIDDAIKINSVRNRVKMWMKGQTNAKA